MAPIEEALGSTKSVALMKLGSAEYASLILDARVVLFMEVARLIALAFLLEGMRA